MKDFNAKTQRRTRGEGVSSPHPKYLVKWVFLAALVFAMFVGVAPVAAGETSNMSLRYPPKDRLVQPKLKNLGSPPARNYYISNAKDWGAKKRMKIFLDAGHGGEDYGTHSKSKPKYHEKYLTLTVAKMVKGHLTTMGYKIDMSRESDEYIALPDRITESQKKRSNLFVSIHFNSAPSVEASGVEIFYYRATDDKVRSDASHSLAQAILGRVIKSTQARSRGVKHGNFLVIRESTIPAVLIEAGFLTNNEEMNKLKDPAYLEKIAISIAKGIDDYIKKL